MAFELAAIDPTSVPINLLNPRPGTKFGDRDYMDPWEAVKWIAIFRLILPAALFRLCGGRVENLGDLQPLAVKAGLNGVMMGNFLTTLGSTPERGPRDVRGAGAQRRPPARQRRQPAAGQPVGLARRRDARPAEDQTPRRRRAPHPALEPGGAAALPQEGSVPPRPDGAPNRGLAAQPVEQRQQRAADLVTRRRRVVCGRDQQAGLAAGAEEHVAERLTGCG